MIRPHQISIIVLATTITAAPAAVVFNTFTGFPGSIITTHGTPVPMTATFSDSTSGQTGVARLTYTSKYPSEATPRTGSQSSFFPNSPGLGSHTARNGTWTLEFFEDVTLTIPRAITDLRIGLIHMNSSPGSGIRDFFHGFTVDGTVTNPSSVSLAANHIYDPTLNAIGGTSAAGSSTTTTAIFSGPVSTLSFQAGSASPLIATPGSPPEVGTGFSVGTNTVHIGVNTNSFRGEAIVVIPEPSTSLLLALSAFAFRRRR